MLLALGLATQASAQGLVRIDVTIGKSQVIELKDAFTRVSVTNPAIADVFVVTPTQILVNGKAVGVTSLVVFYPGRTMFFDLVVQTDLGLLKERLKDMAPRDDIRVQSMQDTVVLSGAVSSQHLIGGAQEVAAAFAPRGRVVNMLTVAPIKVPQVMLQVHVAEASRVTLREMGFSWRAMGRELAAGATPGAESSFAPSLRSLGNFFQGGTSSIPRGTILDSNTPDYDLNRSSFFIASGRRDYAGVVRALAGKNLVRTLAKPNIVTESGREASFLSGGEVPYATTSGLGATDVKFKPFGVRLVVTPTVLDGETIGLQIHPEVSQPDFSRTVLGNPLFTSNEVSTNINLKDGESFAIAGLIQNRVTQKIDKIPVLGDIPIVGALFRTTRFENDETELLFLVTVKLVQSEPVGSSAVPDPLQLLETRPAEKKEFTVVPGIPGVGEIVDRPFGESNLPAPGAPPGTKPGK